MRPAIPAVFLSVLLISIAGSAQTAPPPPLGQAAAPFTAQPRDFTKLPPGWHMSSDRPRTFTSILELPPQALKPRPEWNGARIDPGIIVHPPPSSLGAQPSGAEVAQNEFPGLLLQKIEWPMLKVQPIPTTWPLFKLQPIATLCAERSALAVRSGPTVRQSPK